MTLTSKHKLLIGIGAVVLALLVVFLTRDLWTPLPETTTYHNNSFSITYPREYTAKEYSSSSVVVGNAEGDLFDPLVEVVRYESDRDVALPVSFDAYIERQAMALCGSDGPIEDLACTDAVRAPYTSPQGLTGQELTLTLLRTNLESGTTTTETFGPIYVFNTTPPVESPEDTLRYRAIFVYPSFSTLIAGRAEPLLLTKIIDSLTLPGDVSTVVGR